MHLVAQADWTAGSLRDRTAEWPMEMRTHCAYNETRECFLGLEVAAEDLSYASLDKRMSALALKSGEGLWLTPFRGIPSSNFSAPLDLIYLDEDCRVIETVESFPTFRASSSSPRAASLLVLPAHSIYSSQTKPGDQLLLCVAEELEKRLDRLSSLEQDENVVQSAVLLREQPLWSGGPGVVEMEDRTGQARGKSMPRHEMNLAEPGTKTARAPRNWLERWWTPDPRKAPREAAQGMVAYYWNGAPPQGHAIRDISSTGLYVITEERWYPGTLVLMTLQKTEGGEQASERAIAVQTRAVRWGSDGVGLQFVLPEGQDVRRHNGKPLDGAGKRDLEHFLKQLKKGK